MVEIKEKSKIEEGNSSYLPSISSSIKFILFLPYYISKSVPIIRTYKVAAFVYLILILSFINETSKYVGGVSNLFYEYTWLFVFSPFQHILYPILILSNNVQPGLIYNMILIVIVSSTFSLVIFMGIAISNSNLGNDLSTNSIFNVGRGTRPQLPDGIADYITEYSNNSDRIPDMNLRQLSMEEDDYQIPMEMEKSSEPLKSPIHFFQDLSTLMIGETGSGKSSLTKLLLYQVPLNKASTIIHDYGSEREYEQFIQENFDDIEVVRLSIFDSDKTWSLFADARTDEELMEIASVVNGDMQGSDPFHAKAQDVLQVIFVGLSRYYRYNYIKTQQETTPAIQHLSDEEIQQLIASRHDIYGDLTDRTKDKYGYSDDLYSTFEDLEREGKRTLGHGDVLTLINNPQDLISYDIDEETPTYEIIYNFFNDDNPLFQDLQSKIEHIRPMGDDIQKGPQSTFSNLSQRVESVFKADFAQNPDDKKAFSIREFVDNADGRILTINSLPELTGVSGPIYRVLLESAFRHGLSTESEVNFILDEVDELPPLSQIGKVASKGRSENCRAIFGIQSVEQLRANYDRKGGSESTHSSEILANTPQEVHFSAGDPETAEYTQNEIGRIRQVEETRSNIDSDNESKSERVVERSPLDTEEINKWDSGYGVCISKTEWAIGQIGYYEDFVGADSTEVDETDIGVSEGELRDDISEKQDGDLNEFDIEKPSIDDSMVDDISIEFSDLDEDSTDD